MAKLDHDVAEDLLPGYADGILNESTAMKVEEHLQECEICQKKYQDMTAPVSIEDSQSSHEQLESGSWLKKIRRQNRKRGMILAIFGIVIGIGIAFLIMPGAGQTGTAASSDFTWTIGKNGSSIVCTLMMEPVLSSQKTGFSGTRIETDDHGKTVMLTPSYADNAEQMLTVTIPDEQSSIETIYSDSVPVWVNGTGTSPGFALLWQLLQNPSVSSDQKAAQLAFIAGMPQLFGPFHIEMQDQTARICFTQSYLEDGLSDTDRIQIQNYLEKCALLIFKADPGIQNIDVVLAKNQTYSFSSMALMENMLSEQMKALDISASVNSLADYLDSLGLSMARSAISDISAENKRKVPMFYNASGKDLEVSISLNDQTWNGVIESGSFLDEEDFKDFTAPVKSCEIQYEGFVYSRMDPSELYVFFDCAQGIGIRTQFGLDYQNG